MPSLKPLSRSLPPIASALLGLLVFAITLRGTYIYDDIKIVRTDPRVLEPGQWYQLWTQPFFQHSVDKLYRPLISTSFALENYLHGDRPWIFHAVNIVLHAAVSAAVGAPGHPTGRSARGWIAGVLFAVHPVHVEAVAGLVGRAESACALAMVLGIYWFLRDGPVTLKRGVALCGCFVGALFCKEQGVLFPLLLLVAWPLKYRKGLDAEERKRVKLLGISLIWILAGYLLLREKVASLSWERSQLDWYVNPMILSQGLDRILMPFALLGRYVGLLVFPLHLSIDYGGNIIGSTTSARDPWLWLGLASFVAWCVIAFVAWRKRQFPLLFCLLGLAITYGMVGNVVALIGTIFADRLMYLPSVFFVLVVAIGGSRLSVKAIAPCGRFGNGRGNSQLRLRTAVE